MDADVMITIALCLAVFLFALAGGLFVAREVRKSRSQATAEIHPGPKPIASANPIAADGTRAVTARERRGRRGLRA
jgi:hypothetical protein